MRETVGIGIDEPVRKSSDRDAVLVADAYRQVVERVAGRHAQRELGALTTGLASPDEVVRVTAAIALARRRATALPDAALTVLVHADAVAVSGAVEGWDLSLRGHVAATLRRLGL